MTFVTSRRSVRGILEANASVAAVAAMLACFSGSTSALAQSEGDSVGLDEIVVTAQKKEENLQEVPVAVTAVSTEQVENLQVRTFNDLSGLAPNLSAVQSVSGSDPILTMRGIVGGNATNGTDTAIAMYIDGVYLARTTGSSFDVADLERVEVLRGPQGTLYGKNSTGGAINFITAGPKGEFYARAEGTYGNLDHRRAKFRLDTPKFGAFSLSGTYLHSQMDGWIENLDAGVNWDFSAANRFFPGTRTSVEDLGGHNTEAGFVALRFRPDAGNITADYKFDITDSRRSNQAQQVLVDYTTAIPPSLVSLRRLDAVSMPFTTPEELKTFGHSLTVALEVNDNLSFKSITGYRGSTDKYSNDVAGAGGIVPTVGEFALTNIVAYEKTRGFSQELQLNLTSDTMDFTGGAYFFKEKTTSTAPVYIFQFVPFTLPDRTLLPPLVNGDVTSNNKSASGYAQATLHASSKFDITGGIRYTKDWREADERGSFLGVPRNDVSAEFSRVDWSGNISFFATDDVTFYAKASSGYLSGGAFAGIAFDPETVIQYEVGVKADMVDNRLRVNLAGFHTDYSDLQVAGFYEVIPGNPASTLYHIRNVANANVDGFEAEVTFIPMEGITLNANYGYTDFDYLTPPAGVVNPAYRPKHTLAFNGNFKFTEMTGGMKPILDVNARYTGDQYFLTGTGPATLPYVTNPAFADMISNNDAWLLDMRFTLADIPLGGVKPRLSFWTQNILNNRDLANMTDATGGFLVNGQFRQPRTYGVDLGIEF